MVQWRWSPCSSIDIRPCVGHLMVDRWYCLKLKGEYLPVDLLVWQTVEGIKIGKIGKIGLQHHAAGTHPTVPHFRLAAQCRMPWYGHVKRPAVGVS